MLLFLSHTCQPSNIPYILLMDFVYDLSHLDSPRQNVTSIKTCISNHFFSATYSEQYLAHDAQ